MKNPVDCSLFYLALKKKTVLQGLWRMAGWNREQRATQKLLANNFEDPKWRTTALKNAYALMSKRRFGQSLQVLGLLQPPHHCLPEFLLSPASQLFSCELTRSPSQSMRPPSSFWLTTYTMPSTFV